MNQRHGCGADERSCKLDILGTPPIRQEPKVADLDESWRQDVHQKTAHKLRCREHHEFRPIGIGIVTPPEEDLVVFEREDAVIADRHTVGVARQISQHLPRTTERPLDIRNPLLGPCALDGRMWQNRIRQSSELALSLGLSKVAAEQRLEAPPKNLDRQ